MKTVNKILSLLLLCALILSLSFLVPGGRLIESEVDKLRENDLEDADVSALSFLFPIAGAENAQDGNNDKSGSNATEEKKFPPLPMNLEKGKTPLLQNFKEDGYEDASISVKLETKEENKLVLRIARVKISDPSQLRTGIAGSPKNLRYGMISEMAKNMNAVIAINGDNMANDKGKTSFEYRMGEKIRSKFGKLADVLITDENGDFHFLRGEDKKAQLDAFLAEGHQIINAFTFGPALVVNGEVQQIPKKYFYNPNGREPRMAIGQIGKLEYVLVLAEGRIKNSEGLTQQEMAQVMFDLGCRQAFNLDGGNSATMVYHDGYYQTRSKGNERAQSDMIYFASLAGEE